MNATALRAAAAALVIGLPAALGAVSAAQAQDVPTYAQPSQEGEENIHGRIIAFDGAYNLQVRDERGFVDNVQLHQGTIINPTGLTLEPGMVVSILGYNAGPYLAANEIDTPYTYYGGVPWHGSAFVGGFHYVGGVRVYNNVHFRDVHTGGVYRGRDYVAPPSRGGYVPRSTRNTNNGHRDDNRHDGHYR